MIVSAIIRHLNMSPYNGDQGVKKPTLGRHQDFNIYLGRHLRVRKTSPYEKLHNQVRIFLIYFLYGLRE